VQRADLGDTTTIQQTLPEAAEQLETVADIDDDVRMMEEMKICGALASTRLLLLRAAAHGTQGSRTLPRRPGFGNPITSQLANRRSPQRIDGPPIACQTTWLDRTLWARA